MTDDLDNHDDVPQARGKGPAMSHELHDYAEIYTPSREEPAPWIGPQVTIALLVQAVEMVKVVKLVKVGNLIGGNPRPQVLFLHLSLDSDLSQIHWLDG